MEEDGTILLNQLGGLTKYEARDIKNAYLSGWLWWLRLNDNYKSLIGARENVTEQQLYCECEYQDPYSDYYDHTEYTAIDSEDECDDNPPENWTCRVVTQATTTFVDHPSDGVVLQSSAVAYPGADVGPDNELTGSNHMQMRNDENLETKLGELFLGAHGRFFITDER